MNIYHNSISLQRRDAFLVSVSSDRIKTVPFRVSTLFKLLKHSIWMWVSQSVSQSLSLSLSLFLSLSLSHTHTHTQARTRTHARTHTLARRHACTHAHTPPHTHTHRHTGTHTRTHSHAGMHARTHTLPPPPPHAHTLEGDLPISRSLLREEGVGGGEGGVGVGGCTCLGEEWERVDCTSCKKTKLIPIPTILVVIISPPPPPPVPSLSRQTFHSTNRHPNVGAMAWSHVARQASWSRTPPVTKCVLGPGRGRTKKHGQTGKQLR